VLLPSSLLGLGKVLEDVMSNQPLFQVTNHHGEACGVPPQIDEQTFSGVYRSYFENQNGEQAVFLYDYEQECGTLYMGDAGWEHPYDVVDGKVAGLIGQYGNVRLSSEVWYLPSLEPRKAPRGMWANSRE